MARKDLDHRVFAAEADVLVRETVPYDMAAWSTVDPASMLVTSCTITGPVEEDPDRELRTFEIEWSGSDPATYAELADRPMPAAALSEEVDDLLSVRRYRELMAPMGIGDELRLVFRSGNDSWGTLTAFRTAERPAFTQAEVAALAETGEVMADGVRSAFLRTAIDRDDAFDEPPGQLMTDTEGRPVATTEAAERLLDSLGDPDRVPAVVRSLVSAMRSGRKPSTTLSGSGGPLSLHAMDVKGADGEVAIVVERPRPVVLADLIMRAHGLSERERQVTAEVMWGRTTDQIAARLDISPYTVQDHLKSIFDKVGVVTRGELIAAVYTTHYLPRRQDGADPSPYGFYLEG